MGKRTTEISGKKGEGDNTSRRTVTVNFLGISDQPPVEEPEKKSVPKKAPSVRPNLEDMPYEDRPLSPRQEKFCKYYIKLNNGEQAAIKAGYSKKTAAVIASENLRKPNVAKRINILRERAVKPSIASGAEVMEMLTRIARGEEKDEVGLDISPSDKIKALVELAKRTVDLDNKLAGKPDSVVEIKLDWKR